MNFSKQIYENIYDEVYFSEFSSYSSWKYSLACCACTHTYICWLNEKMTLVFLHHALIFGGNFVFSDKIGLTETNKEHFWIRTKNVARILN